MVTRSRWHLNWPTHDEADAVALACVGAYHLGDPIPWVPAERSVECLAKVDWPVMV